MELAFFSGSGGGGGGGGGGSGSGSASNVTGRRGCLRPGVGVRGGGEYCVLASIIIVWFIIIDLWFCSVRNF